MLLPKKTTTTATTDTHSANCRRVDPGQHCVLRRACRRALLATGATEGEARRATPASHSAPHHTLPTPLKHAHPKTPKMTPAHTQRPHKPPQWPGVGPERGQHKAAGQRWLRETHTRNDPETIQRGAETRAASGSVAQATNPNTPFATKPIPPPPWPPAHAGYRQRPRAPTHASRSKSTSKHLKLQAWGGGRPGPAAGSRERTAWGAAPHLTSFMAAILCRGM